MFEDFINALQNFRTNKIRTLLSLLGVIIGVASVIMVTTIGLSATEDIKSSFGSAGLDLVQVMPGWDMRRAKELEFDEAFRRELLETIPGIRNLVYSNEFGGRLRNDQLDRNLGLSLRAVEPQYFPMMGLKMDYGRFFSVSEQVMGSQKIILGTEAVRYLFPEGRAAGKTVMLQMDGYQLGFEVVGVLEYSESVGFESPNQCAFIPRTTYTRKINPDTKAGNILIQGIDQAITPQIQQQVEALGFEKTGNPQAVYVFSLQSILDQYNQITMSMNLLLSGIAGISLLVGGIGIMNIMIVTVTERKREIGIRKALGASPGAIRMQFLVESATLTLFGGVVGIIIGLLLSYVVIGFFNWVFVIQWGICTVAFLFSAVVGIFFGLHPAIRAAKLDPVEALAGE
ncbi:ABC transporter permease [Breznakiella homolactica]|uniref:ABC transporter permease n=1 Tax=Breznakiella homolactica TaxID=2798577 RepID=A0A7T7XN92_9SPIR|nr:ABC transporter permease [Breznakiella homolactica]QQO09466.1 ABC transporter permease [Breznakiella homolactica]